MASRMWCSLTGNYGNILPLDWKTSRTRELHLKALNLSLEPRTMSNGRLEDDSLNRTKKLNSSSLEEYDDDESLDDEELAKDLDLHSLILNSKTYSEPIFTAEQVLEEIDEILTMQDDDDGGNTRHKTHLQEEDWYDEDEGDQEQSKSLGIGSSVCTTTDTSPLTDASSCLQNDCSQYPYSFCSAFSSLKTTCGQPSLSSLMFEGKWRRLSTAQLNEVLVEQERMIQSYSEILIQELASRDELEFEKEVKNNFISLLLSIQNKRRQCSLDRKKVKSSPLVPSSSSFMSGSASLDSMKYLTTVIPYDSESGPLDLRSLQVLMKSKFIHLLFSSPSKCHFAIKRKVLKEQTSSNKVEHKKKRMKISFSFLHETKFW